MFRSSPFVGFIHCFKHHLNRLVSPDGLTGEPLTGVISEDTAHGRRGVGKYDTNPALQHPAIPRTDADLTPSDHIQAIANTAGFHFGTIEQGGTSLYPQLAQRVTDPQVLRIVLSIGPTEAMHFQTWQDKAGNAPALTDPKDTSLVFPNLNAAPFGGEDFQTNSTPLTHD